MILDFFGLNSIEIRDHASLNLTITNHVLILTHILRRNIIANVNKI